MFFSFFYPLYPLFPVLHSSPTRRSSDLLRPVPAPEDPTPLGRDAARWALLHPAPHDRPRITADHLVQRETNPLFRDRKSTRLNSSHLVISYAVFCLQKKRVNKQADLNMT